MELYKQSYYVQPDHGASDPVLVQPGDHQVHGPVQQDTPAGGWQHTSTCDTQDTPRGLEDEDAG